MRRPKTEDSKSTRPSSKALSRVAPRVIAYAKPYAGMITVGLIGLALGSGINLLFPYLFKKILNNELGISLHENLPWMTAAIIALFALQAFVFYVRHYAFALVGYRIVGDLRQQLFAATLGQDTEFFDRHRTGDLLSRLASDTELVQRSVTMNISAGLRYGLQVVGGIVLMLFISVRLTFVIIFLVPLLVFISVFWARKLRSLSKEVQEHIGQASIVAEEAISSARTVKIFSAEENERRRYSTHVQRAVAAGKERTNIAALFSSSMVFFMHSSIALTFWYGIELVYANTLSVGDLTAFLMYCVIVAASFGFLANVWDEFLQAVGAADRIFEVLDSHPQIVSPQPAAQQNGNGALPNFYSASLSFRNVSFSYPSRPEQTVLDDVTFEIAEGESVALVGPSGSGKSTIAALILRLYDPFTGIISYGGKPIKQLTLEALRRDISVVTQDPQVFSVSIRENILVGKPDATEQEFEEVCRRAHVTDFVSKFPEKFHTLVGNRGTQLSGGERQRLTIARALIKNPRFLILDEATSSLDAENEHLIQKALEELQLGRTTLVIAHRLSTVRNADRVLVLRAGKLVQTGKHESLMNEPGLYRSLVEHQLL